MFNKKCKTHNVNVKNREYNKLVLNDKSLRIKIEKLQERKSRGPDDIPAEMIKLVG